MPDVNQNYARYFGEPDLLKIVTRFGSCFDLYWHKIVRNPLLWRKSISQHVDADVRSGNRNLDPTSHKLRCNERFSSLPD